MKIKDRATSILQLVSKKPTNKIKNSYNFIRFFEEALIYLTYRYKTPSQIHNKAINYVKKMIDTDLDKFPHIMQILDAFSALEEKSIGDIFGYLFEYCLFSIIQNFNDFLESIKDQLSEEEKQEYRKIMGQLGTFQKYKSFLDTLIVEIIEAPKDPNAIREFFFPKPTDASHSTGSTNTTAANTTAAATEELYLLLSQNQSIKEQHTFYKNMDIPITIFLRAKWFGLNSPMFFTKLESIELILYSFFLSVQKKISQKKEIKDTVDQIRDFIQENLKLNPIDSIHNADQEVEMVELQGLKVPKVIVEFLKRKIPNEITGKDSKLKDSKLKNSKLKDQNSSDTESDGMDDIGIENNIKQLIQSQLETANNIINLNHQIYRKSHIFSDFHKLHTYISNSLQNSKFSTINFKEDALSRLTTNLQDSNSLLQLFILTSFLPLDMKMMQINQINFQDLDLTSLDYLNPHLINFSSMIDKASKKEILQDFVFRFTRFSQRYFREIVEKLMDSEHNLELKDTFEQLLSKSMKFQVLPRKSNLFQFTVVMSAIMDNRYDITINERTFLKSNIVLHSEKKTYKVAANAFIQFAEQVYDFLLGYFRFIEETLLKAKKISKPVITYDALSTEFELYLQLIQYYLNQYSK
jgi:hypothetical protein